MKKGVGLNPVGYPALVADLKKRIHAARMRASLAVNEELVLLYWDMGQAILERQDREGWGAKVIDRLSADLRLAFPDMKGLSPRNLKYMRRFAEAWPDRAIVQGVLAQIPWWSNLAILEKLEERRQRLWYARKAREHGWSRNVLVMQIDSALHERQGQALTNFDRILPAPQSDLANALLKDPYVFGFLGLEEEAQEREVEKALVRNLRDFLLELGVGFAFMGNQFRLEVGGVAEYQLTDALPENLRGILPTVEELEATLEATEGKEDNDSEG